MKSMQQKRALYQDLFFASIIILVMQLTAGCKKCEIQNPQESKDGELIVWLKPEIGDSTKLHQWILDKSKRYGKIETKAICSGCDNSLKLLKGPGIAAFISGQPVRGEAASKTSSEATGEDGPVYFSENYDVSSDFNNDVIAPTTGISQQPNVLSYKETKKVKVAVFDTGLEPVSLDGTFLFPLSGGVTCIPGAYRGWNFAGGNANLMDDHTGKHGTTVSRFITEQVIRYSNNPVEILTVKTINSAGAAKLFDILCGFAYAKDREVKIINASFGFYLPRLEKEFPGRYPIDPNVRLLREYVKHYLTKNNILLVAAAGNRDDINEIRSFIDRGFSRGPENLRDLEQVSFYPASLARDTGFPNVIAVTTIDELGLTVSPNQNFSDSVVDIGVRADKVIYGTDGTPHYIFRNPINNDGATVEGSSFAAPIVTGKLCANYSRYQDLIESVSPVNKAAIINRFLPNIISRSPNLERKIKNGNNMKKND